jgi:hypothetical protein
MLDLLGDAFCICAVSGGRKRRRRGLKSSPEASGVATCHDVMETVPESNTGSRECVAVVGSGSEKDRCALEAIGKYQLHMHIAQLEF